MLNSKLSYFSEKETKQKIVRFLEVHFLYSIIKRFIVNDTNCDNKKRHICKLIRISQNIEIRDSN